MTGTYNRLREWCLGLALLAVVAPGSGLAAQNANGSADGTLPAPVPVASAAVRTGPVVIDGRLNEAAWQATPVASGFVQQKPVEGHPADQQTDVRVLFDEGSIYVAARMHDPEPATIARQMVRRDEEGQFDYFAVEFDPSHDRRTGYRFRVSASNVQRDEYLFDDNERDAAWDAVWESAVQFDSAGWTVEFRIPLSQMRHTASKDAQQWGVNFFRRRLRTNEESHFKLISQLQRGHVSQYAVLDGVRIAQTARRIELRPYALSSAFRGPAVAGNPFNDGSDLSARAGLDVRYGLGGQFTLDATINPDFGQVEADPAVINLSAFETFFQERRPFFVEDAKIFDFTLSGGQNRVFYSRRIGRDPHGGAPSDATYSDVPDAATILGAAKITGRTDRGLSMGVLLAVTRDEFGRAYYADSADTQRFLVEPRSGFGVFRLRQDYNQGASTIGIIGSALTRRLPESGQFDNLPTSALGAGVDWEHQWGNRTWAFFGYVAGSRVAGDSLAMIRIQRSSVHYFQRPDSRRLELDSSLTAMGGYDWRMTVEKRRGAHWTGSIWAAEVSPGFEINDLGFSSRNEVLDGGVRVQYREITPGPVLRSYSYSLSTFHNYSHDLLEGPGSRANWARSHVSGSFSVSGNAQLLNYWRFDATLNAQPERMDRTATRGGPIMLRPASVDGRLSIDSDSRKPFTVGPNFSFERSTQDAGFRAGLGADFGFRASSRIDIRFEPNWSRSRTGSQYVTATDTLAYAATFGRRYIFADLERSELSFQTRLNAAFSPTLSLQLFAQPLLSAGDYVTYKQFVQPAAYKFDAFAQGTYASVSGVSRCQGGRTCVDPDNVRHVDFDGDGAADYAFTDRSFNVRSLRGNAVLRWEYRPGSTLFVVWQRRQAGQEATGRFDFRRDMDALLRAPAENVFMIKARYWLGL